MVEDLFRAAMDGIAQKVAMQEIRKVIRGNKPEGVKLELIIGIIHSYEDDAEREALAAERRAIEAEAADMRREKINEMFENMAQPVMDALTIRKGETK